VWEDPEGNLNKHYVIRLSNRKKGRESDMKRERRERRRNWRTRKKEKRKEREQR
jgi:hypothetical protein